MFRLILVVSAIFTVCTGSWYRGGKVQPPPPAMPPLPPFLRNVTEDARREFFNITRNQNETILAQRLQIEQWGQKFGVIDQVNEFNANVTRMRSELNSNVTDLMVRLAQGQQELNLILINENQTRVEQQQAIAAFRNESRNVFDTLTFMSGLFRPQSEPYKKYENCKYQGGTGRTGGRKGSGSRGGWKGRGGSRGGRDGSRRGRGGSRGGRGGSRGGERGGYNFQQELSSGDDNDSYDSLEQQNDVSRIRREVSVKERNGSRRGRGGSGGKRGGSSEGRNSTRVGRGGSDGERGELRGESVGSERERNESTGSRGGSSGRRDGTRGETGSRRGQGRRGGQNFQQEIQSGGNDDSYDSLEQQDNVSRVRRGVFERDRGESSEQRDGSERERNESGERTGSGGGQNFQQVFQSDGENDSYDSLEQQEE